MSIKQAHISEVHGEVDMVITRDITVVPNILAPEDMAVNIEVHIIMSITNAFEVKWTWWGIQDNAVLQEQQDIISEQMWWLQQNDQ